MKVLIYIYLFILGACLGSFLGVVGTRLSKEDKESLINPKRSYCDKCKSTLKLIDLIPIFSYVFSKGKCRYCGEKISFFYPVVEILTGILFIVSYHIFGFSYQFFISLVLVSLLMVIVVSDINYLIIPDEAIISSSILIFIITIIGRGFFHACVQFVYGTVMFLLMYLLMLLGNCIFKKESLGGGDIKLMFVVGLALDPFTSLVVIFLSSIIALPISIVLLLINREHVIPYGPFIALALLLCYFFQVNIDKIAVLFK